MKTSDLENDIKRRIASTKSRDEFDGVQRQISCRINVVRHYQLGTLADKLNTTRTDLAEDLLEKATEIAWSAAGFGELSDEDINAIKALTKTPEARKQEFFDKAEEGNPSTLTNAHPSSMPKQAESMPPNRLDCFASIFGHLGCERGRIKGTLAASRDGSVRVCCLTSKDYQAETDMRVGERYWFTIYDNHLAAIQQAQQAYVAFACGSADQIVLIPASEFSKWTNDLPPYTQGKTGWHVHLSKVSENWELRRKGKHEPPIDTTSFVI